MSLKKTKTSSVSSRKPRGKVQSSTPVIAASPSMNESPIPSISSLSQEPPGHSVAHTLGEYGDPVPPNTLGSDGVDLFIVYDSSHRDHAYLPSAHPISQRNSKRQNDLGGESASDQPSKKSKRSKSPKTKTRSSKAPSSSVTNEAIPVLIEIKDESSGHQPSKKSKLSETPRSIVRESKSSLSSGDSILILSEFHRIKEAEVERRANYENMVALAHANLVLNVENFECPICFSDVDVGEGAILQECLHSFCKDCLVRTIQFSEAVVVRCPFQNYEYTCESHLQEREIKALVTPEMYERYLQRSVTLAESQAENSFHCKTVDCPGWCLFERNVNAFLCPACQHVNCLSCAAIHEGKNCRQYQDDLAFYCDTNEEARKTRECLENELKKGKAMRCPKCAIIIVKRGGCDGLECTMCRTDICWRTKGPRWGPKGRGDKSGGCHCGVNGKPCHPRCQGCH